MLGFDEEKAAKALVDEAALKILPQIEPLLDHFAETLADKLRGLLVGRKITITVE